MGKSYAMPSNPDESPYERLARQVWDHAVRKRTKAPATDNDDAAATQATYNDDDDQDTGNRDDPAATQATDNNNDDAATQAAMDQLAGVRKRAEGWRNGIAGTFTLILASLAIKPGEGFMKYEGGTQILLAWLLGLSVLISLASLLLLIRAANGPSWLQELFGAEANRDRYLKRAQGAYLDFVTARVLWAVALALFMAAVGVTWFVEPPA